jgi:hypothetical protein
MVHEDECAEKWIVNTSGVGSDPAASLKATVKYGRRTMWLKVYASVRHLALRPDISNISAKV